MPQEANKCAENMWWDSGMSKCYCNGGYWWDANKMICVKESDLQEPEKECKAANMHKDYETGKCVCNGAYIYDEGSGGCVENKQKRCLSPEVWVEQFGACHCPNASDGSMQILHEGKCVDPVTIPKK